MSDTSSVLETGSDVTLWQSLARTAIKGLHEAYADSARRLPYTRTWNGHKATCRGYSVRYALIALLGLGKGKNVVGEQGELVDGLWDRVTVERAASALSAGDLGLALWARALHGSGPEMFTAKRALSSLQQRSRVCDSIDIAWLLLGAEHAVLDDVDGGVARRLAEEARGALLALYNPETSLFYRHGRTDVASRVSRRVACFANQVYPLMALSVHARRTGCSQSAATAAGVADKICQSQGELGQWWWLYDAKLGDVVEGYPVFSVHQDGMAPMALGEASLALGRCYDASISRGMRWLFGANECGENTVLREEGIILRDIHRRGVGRVRRAIKGALWCCGRRSAPTDTDSPDGFEINRECRPYHLGWVLYAAGLAAEMSGRP